MATSRCSIAVIEDDAAIADSVRMVLETRGWRVRTYPSGERFLADAARHVLPDCVLLDYLLPGIDGAELLDELAAFELPVVVLTAYPNVLPAEQARELGVLTLLTKPVSAEALLQAIEQALGPR